MISSPGTAASGATGGHYRVGVLVPPENPTVEPEMRILLPAGVDCFTTRLPVVPGDLRGRLLTYNRGLADSMNSFGGMRLDAAYLACTGSSYLVGDDEELNAPLRHSGAEPLTAATAILETLARLGRTRLTILSPYPEWLTRHAVEYWQAHGLEVATVTKVHGESGIYGLTTADVVKHLRALPRNDETAVLLSGTGMTSVEPALQVGQDLGMPILSSTIASAAALMQRAGLEDGLAQELISPWE